MEHSAAVICPKHVIAAFVGRQLGSAGDASLDQALARHPSVRRQGTVGAAS